MVDDAERHAYLDEVCAGDTKLRNEIEDLLARDREAGSFLENPPSELSPTIDQPIAEKPGAQIGPYKLLQQIGEGGMGVVYMAEQKEPVKRRVALKIIKPGMDTSQVIARFEAERQALALMDHPNIAKVLDAGATDSGRPYFVMELVNGLPVTKYCDEQRLTPKERLELFVPICQAVQHAHQKGIIHRDLKPSNVLVALYDGQAVPKVIDFGVAKATNQTLTEKTMFTQLGEVVGTLEYMSPEQAERNQLDVDTRSDIYSLGVLLYELLTGSTPLDRKRLRSVAFDEMLRMIREEEPSKPSTKVSGNERLPSVAAARNIDAGKLGSMIRGELDWIVMKALEKERGRRFATANDLSADITRYLNDTPVESGPPSKLYRFRKFARRNKITLSFAALVILSLTLGIIGTAWQAARATSAEREANAERDRAIGAEQSAEREMENAKTEAAIANAISSFLQNDLLKKADPRHEANREITLREVLDLAAERLEGQFRNEPLVEAAIRNTIVNSYLTLGDFHQAERHAIRATELARASLGDDDQTTLKYRMNLANALYGLKRYAEAERLHRTILEVKRRVIGDEHQETLGNAMNLAHTIDQQGRHAEAEKLYRDLIKKQTRVLGDEHPMTLATMSGLAQAIQGQSRYVEATELFQRTLQRQIRINGDADPATLVTMHNLARCLRKQNRHSAAVKLFRKTLEMRKRVLGKEHAETIQTMIGLANALSRLNQLIEAERILHQAMQISRKALGAEHATTLLSMNNLVSVLQKQGRHKESEKICRQSLAINKRIRGSDHPATLQSMNNLAFVINALGRTSEARELHLQALQTRKRVQGEEHPKTLKNIGYIAEISHDQGHYSEAEKLYRGVIESQRRVLGEAHQDTLKSMRNMAVAISLQGRHPESEALLRKVLTTRQDVLGPEDPKTLDSMNDLGTVLSQQKRYSEAEEVLRRTLELMTRVLGPKHPDTRLSARNLSSVSTKWVWEISSDAAQDRLTYHKALRLAEQAVATNPQNSSGWQVLGWTHYRLGNWQESIKAEQKSIELQNDGGDAWQWLFLAMAHWQMDEKKKAHKFYAMSAASLLESKNEDGVGFLTEAEKLLEVSAANRARVALDYYGGILKDDPTNEKALSGRVELYGKKSLWKEQIADLQKLLEQKPGNITYLSLLALANGMVGRHKQALNVANQAITVNPDDFIGHLRRSEALFSLQDIEGAIKSASQAIVLKPDYFACYQSRAKYYAAKGEWQKAIDDYQRVARLGKVEALNSIAILLLKMGDRESHSALCRRMLDQYQKEPSARFARELVHVCGTGRLTDDLLNKVIGIGENLLQSEGTDFHLTRNLGRLYYRNGNYEKAAERFQAAKRFQAVNKNKKSSLNESSGDRVRLQLWLAMTRYRQGDTATAKELLYESQQKVKEQADQSWDSALKMKWLVEEAEALLQESKEQAKSKSEN